MALYLTLPPSPDQFSHAYMGWRILEGDVLYRDIFDTNWPGVPAFHAIAIFWFGVNLWSWRLFDFLLFGASAFALSDLIRLAVNDDAKKFSLILLPPIYVGANYWIAGQHDMTAAQFLAGAVWFYVRGQQRSSGWWDAGCGVFVALAMLNKPTVGVIGTILPLQTLWLSQSLRVAIKQATVMMVAILAILTLALSLVLSSGASARDIFDLLYTFNFARREVRNKTILELFVRIWSLYNHPWWYPSLIASLPAAIWFLRGRSRTAAGVALSSLWLTGILSYLTQGSGVGYHLAPAFVAMAAAGAASVSIVAMAIRSGEWSARRRRVGAAFIAMVFAMIGVKLIAAFYTLPAAVVDGDMTQHWSRFPTGNGDVTVADTLKFIEGMPNIATRDCVLSVGTDSALNYLSRHRQPTRFYYFDVLVNTRPGLQMTDRWLEYWNEDIHQLKCPLILVGRHIEDNWLSTHNPAADSLRDVLQGYTASGEIGSSYGTRVYTIAPSAGLSN